ncbi:predicted protein [Plenodomus lingam JN3]|uniref:Uncharacterized protein n=1 Tax=Leptosphaeria maculans (strain JN3 / isolate v23.1.3 / race Av1-4-5-6-7-8) TaxID=985895 RepID=E4ZGB5_LEPMJ|nr:predicted protein [Plenodomus lingam JN3]CBX90335.1 predicted protein [Plenodomus lingam JN3]
MSNSQKGDAPGSQSDADLAQAFKELQRGEQTAAALESHLDSLEKKIEEILAQAEKAEQELKAEADAEEQSASETKPNTKNSS